MASLSSRFYWSNRLTEPVSAETTEPIYTSRIIKASALIADTKVLLAEWDPGLPVAENLKRARQLNIFGKASRGRVDDILAIFRQRYFDDPDIGATLTYLVQGGANAQWVDPLLYFFAAQNDRTLRDAVIEALYPRQLAGYSDVPTDYVVRVIRQWVAEGKTATEWQEETIHRVAQGVQATLRDFGVLKGAVRKEIAPIYLPDPSFALIAFWLDQRLHSGNLVLNSDDWKLFFLPVAGVERFFIEAHQEHMLTYNAAGSIVRLDFPAASLADYASFMIDRAR
jgi:hypothetical protein